MNKPNLARVDLNLFVVFEAIYAEGGITRAARRLNLSQPALSHALARLRGLFGDALFARHGRAMAPTPLARPLIEPAREALRGPGPTTGAGRSRGAPPGLPIWMKPMICEPSGTPSAARISGS